jgi:hypothetical protein
LNGILSQEFTQDLSINFILNLLTDLLLSTFLAYNTRNILDFNQVGLHCETLWKTIQQTICLRC